MKSRRIVLLTLAALSATLFSAAAIAQQPPDTATNERGLAPILHYIASGWDTLTRSMTSCDSLVDS